VNARRTYDKTYPPRVFVACPMPFRRTFHRLRRAACCARTPALCTDANTLSAVPRTVPCVCLSFTSRRRRRLHPRAAARCGISLRAGIHCLALLHLYRRRSPRHAPLLYLLSFAFLFVFFLSLRVLSAMHATLVLMDLLPAAFTRFSRRLPFHAHTHAAILCLHLCTWFLLLAPLPLSYKFVLLSCHLRPCTAWVPASPRHFCVTCSHLDLG